MEKKNEIAIVTGASSGIGRELAKLLAADGYDPVLIARSRQKLEELKDEIEKAHQVKARVLVKDLAEAKSAKEIHTELEKERVSILVNNAGFGDLAAFHEADWEKLHAMMQVNMHALTELTHLFLPGMLERKHGKILNLSSTAAFQPGPKMAVYYATKAYVQSFSEAVANELKDTGVTMTALCPGATKTGFQSASNQEGIRLLKMRKMDSAEEVAHFGYRAMMRGEVIAVPGLMNKLGVSAVRFVPRKAVADVVRKIHKKQ